MVKLHLLCFENLFLIVLFSAGIKKEFAAVKKKVGTLKQAISLNWE